MIKLYVAILSRGDWRKELGGIALPRMMATKEVYVGLENPVKTWDIPRASNCNRVRKRFLETDYDFLLLIDQDKVPIGNPAELVFADEDVIGCPYLTRLRNGKVVWSAYKYIQERDSYNPIDIEALENAEDLVAVDAVGGGCMLIKRYVLKDIIFEDIFNEEGIRTRGQDIEFCRMVKQEGFDVYTTPKRKCENFKITGIMGLRDSILEKDNAATETVTG